MTRISSSTSVDRQTKIKKGTKSVNAECKWFFKKSPFDEEFYVSSQFYGLFVLKLIKRFCLIHEWFGSVRVKFSLSSQNGEKKNLNEFEVKISSRN